MSDPHSLDLIAACCLTARWKVPPDCQITVGRRVRLHLLSHIQLSQSFGGRTSEPTVRVPLLFLVQVSTRVLDRALNASAYQLTALKSESKYVPRNLSFLPPDIIAATSDGRLGGSTTRPAVELEMMVRNTGFVLQCRQLRLRGRRGTIAKLCTSLSLKTI